MISISKKTSLGLVLLTLVSAFIWTRALVYSQNNIYFNEHWTIHPSVYSSWNWVESLLGRHPLAGNKLSFSAHPERKRLITRASYHPEKVNFQLSLAPNGHASVFFPIEDGGTKGFRFSRNIFFPSSFYRTDEKGKFLSRETFNIDKFQATGLDVAIEEVNNTELAIKIEGHLLEKFNGQLPDSPIGLEVNQNGEISEFHISESGKTFELPFERNDNFGKFYFLNLIILSLIIVIIWHFGKIKYALKFSYYSLFLSLVWFGFDFYYYSKEPVLVDFQTLTTRKRGPENHINLEGIRYHIFKSWYQLLSGNTIAAEEFFKQHGPLAKKLSNLNCQNDECETSNGVIQPFESALRIIFLGEHFLTGVGAEKIQDTMHVQIQKTLLSSLNPKSNLHTFNAPFFRYHYPRRFEEAFEDCKKFRPHYAVISLTDNIQNPELFRNLIDNLIKSGTKVIYLYDAINPERYFNISTVAELRSLRMSKKIVRKRSNLPSFNKEENSYERLFSQHEILFIDPNEKIHGFEIRDDGLYWLDTTILTSYGQQVIGEIIGKELTKVIKEDPAFRKFFL